MNGNDRYDLDDGDFMTAFNMVKFDINGFEL